MIFKKSKLGTPEAIADFFLWLGFRLRYLKDHPELMHLDSDGNKTIKTLSQFSDLFKYKIHEVDKQINNLFGLSNENTSAFVIHYDQANDKWLWSFWYGYGKNMFWGYDENNNIKSITQETMNWLLEYPVCKVFIIER